MWSIPPSNPEGRAFITVIIVFLLLAVLTFALRIYSRRLNKTALDASDYFCTAALVRFIILRLTSNHFTNIPEILDIGLVVVVWGGKIPQIRDLALLDNLLSILAWLG